ncbi:MAG: AraC family transcriptional regulator [Lachnospiraceae bacterium]
MNIITTPLRIDHTVSHGFVMRKLHFHNFYEIYFSLTDDIEYVVNDTCYRLNKYDILIFNQHDIHGIVSYIDKMYERYIINFDPSVIKPFCDANEDLLACFENRSSFFQHKIQLSESEAIEFSTLLTQEPNPSYPLIAQKIQLSQILIFINERYKSSISNITTNPNNIYFQKIEPVIAYIEAHICETLSLDELTQVVMLEKSYFSKIFKKATGFTIHEYITLKRMLKAEQLLREGKSIIEVSESVGYQTSTHFSTKFKEYWGMPPSQFTKHHLK